jgi:DNA (cytosine-5)-methyltransferase 1
MLPSHAVVDLYCGAGGLTHGFFLEDFQVVAGIDIDDTCKYAFEHNNQNARYIQKDIRQITKDDLNALYPEGVIKILVGCAPCQPFSSYSRTAKIKDQQKWVLLDEFARLVKEVKPEIVSMENVQGLVHTDVYQKFYDGLAELGYQVSVNRSVYCPNYGIPQTRTRLILLASRLGEIKLIPSSHNPENYLTVSKFIADLPPLKAGDTDANDPLHRASKLSPTNLERIQASKPGGTWSDWPKKLIAKCHRRKKGKSYKNVYGRMTWSEPAPTITTQCYGFGNGRFGHPEQDRAISLREAALLQTFPPDYQFVPTDQNYQIDAIARMIGNAVPVELGRVIAKSIKAHLQEHSLSKTN